MYIPAHFEETRTEIMHELMQKHSLGTLVTLGSNGLNANHIPFEIDRGAGPHGTLRAHVARGNALWRERKPEVEALVVFQGPQAYISPSWYASKKEDERVVPTYNFIAVHANGPLSVIDDPAWLRAHLERLTDGHESGNEPAWKVSDAPPDYIDKLLRALVGIEIPVTRLVGKWKVSQNQPAANRAGVEQGLRALGSDSAAAMADAVALR